MTTIGAIPLVAGFWLCVGKHELRGAPLAFGMDTNSMMAIAMFMAIVRCVEGWWACIGPG